jgi:small nuclear ribonucleoprotein D3
VTVEMKNGEIYRGQLTEAEDSMNCQLSGVTLTARDGQITKLEHCYLRGSQIRFVILPDLLKNAPMFKKVQKVKEARDEAMKSKKKGACCRCFCRRRILHMVVILAVRVRVRVRVRTWTWMWTHTWAVFWRATDAAVGGCVQHPRRRSRSDREISQCCS